MTNKHPHQFHQQWQKKVPELNLTAIMFEHAVTKTPLLWLKNQHQHKLFNVCFTTIPSDSTGVAHILEHSVLGGSKKYPVKEPFVELLKHSVSTFQNAITYPDKTMYPVSSLNDQDLHDLMDVYLDALFNPLLSENTFQQEGWRFELDNDSLLIKGVVYNEMRGTVSNPEKIADDYLLSALYPNSIYALDAGGKPQELPKLSYRKFIKFYQTYYHPSNAKIIMHGDLDIDDYLTQIDTYFSPYSYQKPAKVPKIATIKHPKKVTKYYANANSQDGIYLTAWSLPSSRDSLFFDTFEFIEWMLVSSHASPLIKALLEADLGKELFMCGLDTNLKQPIFSVGMKGIKPVNLVKVKKIIEQVITEMSQNIDPRLIEAAMNKVVYAWKDPNTSSPVSQSMHLFSRWHYGLVPLTRLSFQHNLDYISQQAHKGYFEKFIGKYLAQNSSKLELKILPSKILENKLIKEEQLYLAKLKNTLSEEDKHNIKIKNVEFAAWQQKPNSPAQLNKIPRLTKHDFSREVPEFDSRANEIDGIKVHHSKQATNGLSYLEVTFDISNLPTNYWMYIPWYCSAISQLGTTELTYDEVALISATHTGNYSVSPESFYQPLSLTPKIYITVSISLRNEKIKETAQLLAQLISQPNFTNQDRLFSLLKESQAEKARALLTSAHSYAGTRGQSHLHTLGLLDELTTGVTQYQFLSKIVKRKSGLDIFPKTFNTIHNLATQPENIIVHCTSEQPEKITPHITKVLSQLPKVNVVLEHDVVKTKWLEREAFVIPSQVGYTAQVLNLKPAGYEINGYYGLIYNFITTNYLWKKVRAEGGAYGAYVVSEAVLGILALISYRDPNLNQTLKHYQQLSNYLSNVHIDTKELDGYIVKGLGLLDNLTSTPQSKGEYAFSCYLFNMDKSFRQKLREQTFNTQEKHLQELAALINKTRKEDIATVVFGSREQVKEVVRKHPQTKVTELIL